MRKILYILVLILFFCVGKSQAQFDDYNPNTNKVEVLLFPNPLVGSDFKIKTDKTPTSILVMNTLGTIIYREESIENTTDQQYNINLGNQRAGIYFVKVEYSGHKRIIKKLLIK